MLLPISTQLSINAICTCDSPPGVPGVSLIMLPSAFEAHKGAACLPSPAVLSCDWLVHRLGARWGASCAPVDPFLEFSSWNRRHNLDVRHCSNRRTTVPKNWVKVHVGALCGVHVTRSSWVFSIAEQTVGAAWPFTAKCCSVNSVCHKSMKRDA